MNYKKVLTFVAGILLVLLPLSIDARRITEPPRAMWVWDVKIPASKTATTKLLDFCRSRNINRLYLSATHFNKKNSTMYRIFNKRAHRRGIFVYALGGDPRWGLQRYHQQPLRWVEDVVSFNRSSRRGERFDGIQNDTEVYLLGKPWEQNKSAILKQYLDLNMKICELREIEEIDLPYACDIPFWYDDDPSLVVHWNGSTKPPSFHILDTIDSITIMDYRNFADGPNGSIKLAENEIAYADSVNKKVYIGQETKENIYPEYITFGGMTEHQMEEQIKKLVAAYYENPSFAGIAIHHYASYRKLVEEK